MIFGAGTIEHVLSGKKRVTTRDLRMDDLVFVAGGKVRYCELSEAIKVYALDFYSKGLELFSIDRKDKNGQYRNLFASGQDKAACPGRGKHALGRVDIILIEAYPLNAITPDVVRDECVPWTDDDPAVFIEEYRKLNRWPADRPNDWPVARIWFAPVFSE